MRFPEIKPDRPQVPKRVDEVSREKIARVQVRPSGLQADRHQEHLSVIVTGRVELQGVAGDQQERGLRRAVAYHAAQVGEGVAQVTESVSVGPIGP